MVEVTERDASAQAFSANRRRGRTWAGRSLCAAASLAVTLGFSACGGSARSASSTSGSSGPPPPVSISQLQSCLAQAGASVETGLTAHLSGYADLGTETDLFSTIKGMTAEGGITINGTIDAEVYRTAADAQAVASKNNDASVVVSNNVLWASFGAGGNNDVATCANGG